MLRRLIVPVIVLTLVTAAAMAQECPHAAKPAGCAGEDPSLGKDRCIWSWEGVQWTLLEKPDAVVAQAVVPGCSKRSAAIRSSMAAQIPTCKGEACGCSCPFSTEGLTFEVRNEERSLFVTATG
ncbi:MAG: hypothetical protein FJ098_07190, partial [Deltaproteobacteria bacterium]|nr:hypothetical protein [Deltaproteobacteria bacterium]